MAGLLVLWSTIFFYVRAEFSSYREACLSGQYNRLSDLHQFVTDYVDQVEGEPSKEYFLNNYLWKPKPLLMKGAAKHWKAYKVFTDDYLRETHGNVKFYVDFRKHYSTANYVRRHYKLKDFLKNYQENDWYLDSITMDPEFHHDIDLPGYLNVSGIFDGDEYTEFTANFYLSSGHTNSPVHYDGYNNLLTSLRGSKQWIIGDLDQLVKIHVEDYVDFPNVSPINVTNLDVENNKWICDMKWSRAIVEEGDTLYVPQLWPHQVYSPKSLNMAIGLWFSCWVYDNDLNERGYFDETASHVNISASKKIMEEHIKHRQPPCDVMDCSPVKASSMKEIIPPPNPDLVSRDDDVLNNLRFFLQNRTASLTTIVYGTGGPDGSINEPYENVKKALNMGYRFIDTAQLYGNEAEVGRAVRDCKWKREAIAVATKVDLENFCESKPTSVKEKVIKMIEKSNDALNLDWIDVFLIHDASFLDKECLLESWRALEEKVMDGIVKYIGLSNTDIETLTFIYENMNVPITFVQNVLNPLYYDKEVYTFTRNHDILFMAFGITGEYFISNGYNVQPTTEHPVVKEMAVEWFASPVGILYSWAARKKVLFLTRTQNEEHMKTNMEEFTELCLGTRFLRKLDDLLLSWEEFDDKYHPHHDPSEL